MRREARYLCKEGVARREIAGETFLIPVCGAPVDMNDIFVLNPLADYIWQRLDGKRTATAIVDEIVAEFDVEPARAQEDFKEFVGRLLGKGLARELP